MHSTGIMSIVGLLFAGGLCAIVGGIFTMISAGVRKYRKLERWPHHFRHGLIAFIAGIASMAAGFSLFVATSGPAMSYTAEVVDVVTSRSGQVYLITSHYDALRCSVAAECTTLKSGDTAVYHVASSSRIDIQDVHKG